MLDLLLVDDLLVVCLWNLFNLFDSEEILLLNFLEDDFVLGMDLATVKGSVDGALNV